MASTFLRKTKLRVGHLGSLIVDGEIVSQGGLGTGVMTLDQRRELTGRIASSFEACKLLAEPSVVQELTVACRGALTALLLGEHVDKNQAIKHLKDVLSRVESA